MALATPYRIRYVGVVSYAAIRWSPPTPPPFRHRMRLAGKPSADRGRADSPPTPPHPEALGDSPAGKASEA
ncbi:protein of unknown function [Methylacidimicrobium sp. AP8]|nr:protein of unknown function [Methylacidimicrobium sp. AP8]